MSIYVICHVHKNWFWSWILLSSKFHQTFVNKKNIKGNSRTRHYFWKFVWKWEKCDGRRAIFIYNRYTIALKASIVKNNFSNFFLQIFNWKLWSTVDQRWSTRWFDGGAPTTHDGFRRFKKKSTIFFIIFFLFPYVNRLFNGLFWH